MINNLANKSLLQHSLASQQLLVNPKDWLIPKIDCNIYIIYIHISYILISKIS